MCSKSLHHATKPVLAYRIRKMFHHFQPLDLNRTPHFSDCHQKSNNTFSRSFPHSSAPPSASGFIIMHHWLPPYPSCSLVYPVRPPMPAATHSAFLILRALALEIAVRCGALVAAGSAQVVDAPPGSALVLETASSAIENKTEMRGWLRLAATHTSQTRGRDNAIRICISPCLPYALFGKSHTIPIPLQPAFSPRSSLFLIHQTGRHCYELRPALVPSKYIRSARLTELSTASRARDVLLQPLWTLALIDQIEIDVLLGVGRGRDFNIDEWNDRPRREL
ncbi:hypothetical protein D9615_006063 [Tricholomella constricta]|uniref:Uncharacterized protein n=1 Tax=Tricholomella constricta TaxID=117010 RepID=A0A8H5H9I9_9AGAR|nr:hypothetical protein D9615_006063 [Tricholomella constricta]